MYVMVGSQAGPLAPNSAHHLIVDKVQGLRSGILNYTSLVKLQMNVETRVKAFIALCGLRRKHVGGRSTVEAWISTVIEQVCLSQYIFVINFTVTIV